MTPKQKQQFRAIVRSHFKKHGRSFPWRKTEDPYHILVSELMLQQTQAPRVVPKFEAFIDAFPKVSSLAKAQLADVLRLWQGLGYNRRAKFIWLAAKDIENLHAGYVPTETSDLLSLPGVGPYTAKAIRAFAWNKPEVIIETNIRAVYIHHFFTDKNNVADLELLPLIEETLDGKNPRSWYNALMDYGTYLKETLPNPSRKSNTHATQSKFAGSKRELRGAILRELHSKNLTQKTLMKKVGTYGFFTPQRFVTLLDELSQEGLISRKNGIYRLG